MKRGGVSIGASSSFIFNVDHVASKKPFDVVTRNSEGVVFGKTCVIGKKKSMRGL